MASVRWVASAAHAGPGSLSLWVIAIVAFFIPSALVVASLAHRFPEEGGLYVWTRNAFGEWHGFLCSWLYFLSNLLFLPSSALVAVALSGYVWNADPAQLAQNRVYAITCTLLLLWAAFMANLFGLNIGKWAVNAGAAATWAGTIVLACVAAWLYFRGGSVTPFTLIPRANFDSLNMWSQIAFALVGLELGPILGGEIVNPSVTVPRAAWISAAASALFYLAGTAALLVLVRPEQTSQITGLAQAGVAASQRLDWPSFGPFVALLMTLGIFGALTSWIAGNTRLPFVIGLDRYLPEAFARLHPRFATPHISILTQAGAATLLLLATQAGETVVAAYQILVDMTVITTFLPFLYIFGAGWKYGQRLASGLGLSISMAAIVLSAIPPPEVHSWKIFEAKVMGGCVVLWALGWVIFRTARRA